MKICDKLYRIVNKNLLLLSTICLNWLKWSRSETQPMQLKDANYRQKLTIFLSTKITIIADSNPWHAWPPEIINHVQNRLLWFYEKNYNDDNNYGNTRSFITLMSNCILFVSISVNDDTGWCEVRLVAYVIGRSLNWWTIWLLIG